MHYPHLQHSSGQTVAFGHYEDPLPDQMATKLPVDLQNASYHCSGYRLLHWSPRLSPGSNNFMLSQKNLWPTFTTRGTITEELSAQIFSKERRRLQAHHLWMVVNLKWKVLAARMYVNAPTGKPKEDLETLLFDRVARRNCTDPYDEKKYSGAGLREVQTWWKTCKEWMARYKTHSEPFIYDIKKLLKALSDKEAAAQSEVDAFMENCAKRWQTREGTYQLKRRRLPDVRDLPEYPGADIDMEDI
eukprot:symbB.v1.2.036336.t1/scaffold5108.1/size30838/1